MKDIICAVVRWHYGQGRHRMMIIVRCWKGNEKERKETEHGGGRGGESQERCYLSSWEYTIVWKCTSHEILIKVVKLWKRLFNFPFQCLICILCRMYRLLASCLLATCAFPILFAWVAFVPLPFMLYICTTLFFLQSDDAMNTRWCEQCILLYLAWDGGCSINYPLCASRDTR